MTAVHTHQTTFETPSDLEIRTTRVFDAPRELVFAAWTDPAHVPHWMGPSAHAMTKCEIDLRVGGAYRYEFALADGSTMGFGGVYKEIAAPDRLVSTELFDDYPGECVNTMILTEENGRTTCVVTSLCESKEIRDGWLGSMQSGVIEGYERMDTLLVRMAA